MTVLIVRGQNETKMMSDAMDRDHTQGPAPNVSGDRQLELLNSIV